MDHSTIEALRDRHPAWRLLRASNVVLILSFLGQFFVDANRGACPASVVAAALDDHLYALNAELTTDAGEPRFPRAARAYLEDWAATDAAYLRRFYPPDDDEVHYEVTPAFEKAYAWVSTPRGAPSWAPLPGCTLSWSCCDRSCTAPSPTQQSGWPNAPPPRRTRRRDRHGRIRCHHHAR
jgi:hypothetical protein